MNSLARARVHETTLSLYVSKNLEMVYFLEPTIMTLHFQISARI